MQEPETLPASSFWLMQEPETLQESALRLTQETETFQESAKGEAAAKLWEACFGDATGKPLLCSTLFQLGLGRLGESAETIFSGPQQERRILSHWFRLWHDTAQN